MKKNSFTLIELIGVLLLLGTISLITIPNVLKSINDANSLASNEQIAAIKEASLNYSVKNNLGYYNDYEKVISFDDLINGGFLTEKDIKAKDGNRLPGCVIYKWLDNSKQYNFRYDAECNPVTPTVQITFNVLGNALNSNGWASSEFYVQVNVNNANSYKWCSTTSDICTPTALITKNTNSVLISSNSLTNKICVQAKNINNEEQGITCSDNYKLDSNLPNIASNSGNYVVVTPTTSINVIDYFNYSSSGSSNIASTSCKNTTANQDITETSSLAIGDYNIECTATTESGKSNSANITLSISNCFSFSSNSINDYYCYVGNTGGYQEISDVTIPYSINKNNVVSIGGSSFTSKSLNSVDFSNATELVTIASGPWFSYSFSICNYDIGSNKGAFSANNIGTIDLSKNTKLTDIGSLAFANNQINSLILPNSITKIEYLSFLKNSISSFTGTVNLQSIEEHSFANNIIDSLDLSNSSSLKSLSGFGCNRITNVTIPNSVTNIGTSAFRSNQLTSVTIPDSVIGLGLDSFAGNQLNNIIIGNSVKYIGESAFVGNQLSSVIIPNSVISIEYFAFDSNQLTVS